MPPPPPPAQLLCPLCFHHLRPHTWYLHFAGQKLWSHRPLIHQLRRQLRAQREGGKGSSKPAPVASSTRMQACRPAGAAAAWLPASCEPACATCLPACSAVYAPVPSLFCRLTLFLSLLCSLSRACPCTCPAQDTKWKDGHLERVPAKHNALVTKAVGVGGRTGRHGSPGSCRLSGGKKE